jgi:hypothetical protein
MTLPSPPSDTQTDEEYSPRTRRGKLLVSLMASWRSSRRFMDILEEEEEERKRTTPSSTMRSNNGLPRCHTTQDSYKERQDC